MMLRPLILPVKWWRGELLFLTTRNRFRILVEKADVTDRFFVKRGSRRRPAENAK